MKRLWVGFTLVMWLSFLVLGWNGGRIYQEKPPIPSQVVTTDGTVLVADGEIAAGQNVWQSFGGMEDGSVWGYGSYVATDWTADWLHREAMFILDHWARYPREDSFLGAELFQTRPCVCCRPSGDSVAGSAFCHNLLTYLLANSLELDNSHSSSTSRVYGTGG